MANQLPEVAGTAWRGNGALTTPSNGGFSPPGAPSNDRRGGPVQELYRYLGALEKRKWWVLLIVTLGTAGGVLASRWSEPVYSAQSTIWIEVNQGRSDPAQTNQLLSSMAWVDLLRSFYVLDYAVIDQRLYLEPRADTDRPVFADFRLKQQFRPGDYRLQVDREGRVYTLATREGITVEQGEVGAPVGSGVGFEWTPSRQQLTAGRRIDFTVHHPRAVSQEIGRKLGTRMAPDGNFLRLDYSDTNAERTAATLNAIADRYVAVAAELKKTKLDELTAILDEQLQAAEVRLRESEIALEGFRVNTITLPSDRATPITPGLESTRDPVIAGFFRMRVDLEEVRRDRESLRRALTESEPALLLSSLEVIPSARGSVEMSRAMGELAEKEAELRALRNRYADDFVLVRRLSEDIDGMRRSVIPRIATNLISELDQREGAIQTHVQSASTELRQIPPRAIEEARLERNVTLASTLYTNLRQRFESARLASASSIPDIRILDAAPVPQKPQKDNRYTFILMGILGSLGVAVAGVVLLDRVDSSVRFPDQVSRGMGLSILAMVPRLTGRNGESSPEQLAVAVEVFNELKFSLRHSQPASGPLVLTVTSPSSGDGKSFVSSNLALIAAEMGTRTLLIDGDVRRGKLHRLLNLRGAPGLTDYLAGQASIDDIVQPSSHPSLSVITCGTRVRHGSKLLRSPLLPRLLERMKGEYDMILVDSSPFGPGVDPFFFATLTENMVVVLRAGATDRTLTESKLEALDRLPIRVLGAVLNDVPMTGAYRYYYSPYFASYDLVEDPELAAAAPAGAADGSDQKWLSKG
jgi:polysaccharide biosynthesis transport protein